MLQTPSQPAQNATLSKLRALGKADTRVSDILLRLGHAKFFTDFTKENVEQMSSFMQVYRAEPGEVIIQEEDIDDFMLIIIEGRVNIVKDDAQGESRPMSIVGPGATLGEMSMIDGEPRFATCIAIDTTTFCVLSRDSMVRIILEAPALGSKILIRLVTLLSQRLRATSSDLLQHLERSVAV